MLVGKTFPGALAIGLFVGAWLLGCSSTQAHSPPSAAAGQFSGQEAVATESASRRGQDRRAAPTNRHAVESAPADASQPDAQLPETDDDSTPQRGQQLIYTGVVVLAIYDVESTQTQAIELIENLDGYVSRRTSRSLTLRVPAELFRPALDQLSRLGDALDTRWEAQDVTDKVRDLDIRLKNATELRNRLEVLLDRAETIEEILEIEKELERVTLEVERIRGTMQSLEDRIAYSTIEVQFRRQSTDDVPDDDFLLPFHWLNTLGLQSLLNAPGVYR